MELQYKRHSKNPKIPLLPFTNKTANDFVQKWLDPSIIKKRSELLWLWSEGNTGKSTFLRQIHNSHPDIIATSKPSLILCRRYLQKDSYISGKKLLLIDGLINEDDENSIFEIYKKYFYCTDHLLEDTGLPIGIIICANHPPTLTEKQYEELFLSKLDLFVVKFSYKSA